MGGSQLVHSSICTLSADGTRVMAKGAFSPPATLPIDAEGQQVGAMQLQLTVVASGRVFGKRSLKVPVGETLEGVSVGQTSWHLATTVERIPGLSSPHRCLVSFQTLGAYGALPS
ncbi:MAG TPA: hypothetical protein VHX67_08425 [Acidimicrobiales bacterium]|nr:hypothetical protein [Acidimicrobiales bacterium]